MYSDDQVFEISGSMNQLEETIAFAIRFSNHTNSEIFYQITDDGKYCLGWHDARGWTKFPFEYDPHIISKIVEQHLNKQETEDPYAYADGTSEKGFLMKAIPEVFSDEVGGIKEPFYGIVSIEPHYNYYGK